MSSRTSASGPLAPAETFLANPRGDDALVGHELGVDRAAADQRTLQMTTPRFRRRLRLICTRLDLQLQRLPRSVEILLPFFSRSREPQSRSRFSSGRSRLRRSRSRCCSRNQPLGLLNSPWRFALRTDCLNSAASSSADTGPLGQQLLLARGENSARASCSRCICASLLLPAPAPRVLLEQHFALLELTPSTIFAHSTTLPSPPLHSLLVPPSHRRCPLPVTASTNRAALHRLHTSGLLQTVEHGKRVSREDHEREAKHQEDAARYFLDEMTVG